MRPRWGGSSLYLLEGDEITLLSALYGCLLRSGNDCAVVVAETIAGSEEAFADLMNEKAAELGMTSSHFVSCNGLVDEDNYSTARDMAVLGAYAIQNELFAEICGTWVITTEDGYWIENHNKLLSYDDRCIGIKTGYTSLAGRTLVSCAQDPDTGERVVCVTLNDSYDFDDHIAVYDWAFATYTPKTLCTAGETVTTLTFAGNGATATLVTAEDVTYPLLEGGGERPELQNHLFVQRPQRHQGGERGGQNHLLPGRGGDCLRRAVLRQGGLPMKERLQKILSARGSAPAGGGGADAPGPGDGERR
ncbi:MAG: hypothetical protein LUD82_02225 [Clostridiales bacterium]|nr:hypothetical protein [Clostridiales bacterium]